MASSVLPPSFYTGILVFIPILVLHCVAARGLHPISSNASDEESLLAFKSAIQYDNLNSLTTWTPNVSFCKWTGIACSSRRQRVVSVNLTTMSLEGTISPFLGNLSFLRILDLSYNILDGHIPSEIGRLSRLRVLDLRVNRLQGSIPTTISGCRRLINFTVWTNHLTGNIPAELGFLPLEFVSLSRNNLTGNIPTSLGNISSLKFLSMQENELNGRIPWELGKLSQVNAISLSINNLIGEIPLSFSNCTSLSKLSLVKNYFTGKISSQLCSKNTQLTELYMGSNKLRGTIPIALSNCSQLQKLDLAGNNLSGMLPIELGKLTRLNYLNLESNQFVSLSTTSLPIITALTNCSFLNILSLDDNLLAGVLPSSIGQLSTKLESLYFGRNKIRGQIPPEIGTLTNLTLLSLEKNLFTGVIPSTIGKLQRLQYLNLNHNNLEGKIPGEISQLKSLDFLNLVKNKLYGHIPDSLGQLQQLRTLFLNRNHFTGNIPASLGECKKLELLDLSYNRLSGNIPPEVLRLENIAFLFSLSNNLLEGPLAADLSKMDKVLVLDVSANKLSGHIPSALASCIALEDLYLSNNEFSGPIPDTLGKLQNLREIDFSSNNLFGSIPTSLGKLKALQHLNFSFNQFAGVVPKGGVFKSLGSTSFIGNPGLCGPWVKLPPCYPPKVKRHRKLKRVVIPIVVGTTLLIWCVLMGYLWRRYCRKHRKTPPLKLWPQRISLPELVKATDGFDDANLLGVGSFGKVYKGVLSDGTMVAVKVLILQNEDGGKSFDRECKVLRRVRHRNVLRIITSYSDLELKALIFPLMPNGSLDKFLYPEGSTSVEENTSRLDLTQRLNIAIDIAQGMEYLHHHCFVQVVHCDLKPSNVLLGDDMTAHLTDFGISRLCFGNSAISQSSTNTLKGSIGYIAPEYGTSGSVTTKGDIFSYGIVLLEMVTLKRPTDSMFVEGLTLQNWVSKGFPNTIVEVVDSNLLSTTATNEQDKVFNCLRQLLSLGLVCTKGSPSERPSMVDIVRILNDIRGTFLGAAPNPSFRSDISSLLAATSYLRNDESGTSSSF